MSARADPRLPERLRAVRPRRAYVVCVTPRSGSTLLCELLVDSGIAGRPAEHVELLRATGRPDEPREYFAGVEDRTVLELLPASAPPQPHSDPIEARLATVIADATTPNGAFGTKVMWRYMGDLQERLAELEGFAALGDVDRLAGLLGDVRFVRVEREDRVAQAVSLWRAVQTRAWRADADEAGEPVYSFGAIEHLVGRLEADDAAWERWFGEQGVSPLRISYSRLADDPAAVPQRTLDFIGVSDALVGDPPVPSMRRQAGEQSREWADRYRREAQSRR